MANDNLQLYGKALNFSTEKVQANTIRTAFYKLASEWQKKTHLEFYKTFSNLDNLYEKSDELANKIRSESIDAAMTILTAHGIYDISGQQFFEQFMDPYDIWDDDFEPIASQYEAMQERTAELDAHRTARRLNRSKWVGYGSKEAVYKADADNLTSNIGHGVFNLMAKGVTALGNSIKKSEIFKSSETVTQVADGFANIVMAACSGVVDAINSEKPGTVHTYTSDEIARADAIVENVNKSRIPKDNILPSLLKALDTYPYNHSIYVLLLRHCGADQSRLDGVIRFFGLPDLEGEKKKIFTVRRNGHDLATLSGLQAHLPGLQQFAEHIGYFAFEAEVPLLQQAAAKKALEDRIASLNLGNAAAFRASMPMLTAYACEIGCKNYESMLSSVLDTAIANDFEVEASKFKLDNEADFNRDLPSLQAYAEKIGYRNFSVWVAAAHKKIEHHAAQAVAARQAAVKKEKTRRYGKRAGAFLAVAFIFNMGVDAYIDYDKRNAFEARDIARRQEALEKSAETDQATARAAAEAALQATKLAQARDEQPTAVSEPLAVVDAAALPEKLGNQVELASSSAQRGSLLSEAAKEAIREGFVDIKDSAVEACLGKKVAAFRRAQGPDVMINYEMNNEWAVECGFNI